MCHHLRHLLSHLPGDHVASEEDAPATAAESGDRIGRSGTPEQRRSFDHLVLQRTRLDRQSDVDRRRAHLDHLAERRERNGADRRARAQSASPDATKQFDVEIVDAGFGRRRPSLVDQRHFLVERADRRRRTRFARPGQAVRAAQRRRAERTTSLPFPCQTHEDVSEKQDESIGRISDVGRLLVHGQSVEIGKAQSLFTHEKRTQSHANLDHCPE